MAPRLRITMLATAVAALFQWAPCQAVDLPAAVQQTVKGAGLTINSDGSINVGSTRYVPLLPPNYNPNTAVTSAPTGQADGSIVWGNLQFAPVISVPGEMPHLPDNLKVANTGASLPPDFQPPAGFVPSSAVPLPSGVTVPPLTS